MTLADLEKGTEGTISKVDSADTALKQHIIDMGLTPGTRVSLVKTAPMGDPIQFRVRGYELTLRKSDAALIEIKKVHKLEQVKEKTRNLKEIAHPQKGEMGVYHVKKRGDELPEGTTITFALAGNQNCGKTTLFNRLTGSNQHVGNFPGVTIDRKDGVIIGHPNTLITDLPGIYSMSPYSEEENVTKDFLIKNRPHGIINIVDATNIERNLYLTMQLMELDIPMVLALNMMDEVRENGGTVLVNTLEEILGIPVIPISAAKNEGINELVEHALHVAQYRERPGRMDFCDENGHDGGAMHRCLHAIIHLINDHAHSQKLPVRFAATKIVENDKSVINMLRLEQNELDALEHIIVQMEEESGKERQTEIADMRYEFIDRVSALTVIKPQESKEHLRSVKIDKILFGFFSTLTKFSLETSLLCD